MSQIIVRIDLDRYNGEDIIKMIEQGLITVAEVEESGRAATLFNDDLKLYLWKKRACKAQPTRMRRIGGE